MRLLDTDLCQSILHVTTRILREYFFYDSECLGRFIDSFIEKIKAEYSRFECAAHQEMMLFLKFDVVAREHFTSYFVSYHLHDLLVDDFCFTEIELNMFDNILPKFVGVQDAYAEQRHKRAHY
jgi:hypothetical protein